MTFGSKILEFSFYQLSPLNIFRPSVSAPLCVVLVPSFSHVQWTPRYPRQPETRRDWRLAIDVLTRDCVGVSRGYSYTSQSRLSSSNGVSGAANLVRIVSRSCVRFVLARSRQRTIAQKESSCCRNRRDFSIRASVSVAVFVSPWKI